MSPHLDQELGTVDCLYCTKLWGKLGSERLRFQAKPGDKVIPPSPKINIEKENKWLKVCFKQ
jgi:hypothetical protein